MGLRILLISPVQEDLGEIGLCHIDIDASNFRLSLRQIFNRSPDLACNQVEKLLAGIYIVRGSLHSTVVHLLVEPWNKIEHSLQLEEIMCPEDLHLGNPAVAERNLLHCAAVQYPECGIASLDAHAEVIPFGVGNRVCGIQSECLKPVGLPAVSCSAASLVGVIGAYRACTPMRYRIPAHAPILRIRSHKCGIGCRAELVGAFRSHQQFLADRSLRRIVKERRFIAGCKYHSGKCRKNYMSCFHNFKYSRRIKDLR